MGSFEDHVRYGVAFYAAAVVVSLVPLAYGFGDGALGVERLVSVAPACLLGFVFALAGASFPDIDHHSAKPHRFFRRWVAVGAGAVGGYFLFVTGVGAEAGAAALGWVEAAPEAPETVLGGGVSVVGGVAAGAAAFVAVSVLKPRHRGVTHSPGAGVVVALGVCVCVWYAASFVAPSVGVLAGGVAGASFFVGFLSHLQCDGLLVGFLPDAM
jgi:hypothetical protein